MGAVCIEETAAICAQFLDDLLRSNRALRDGLVGDGVHHGFTISVHHGFAVGHFRHLHGLDQFHRVVRLQILNHALRHEQQRSDDAGRQQNPKIAADQVNPEIADRLLLPASDAANECDRQERCPRPQK